MPRRNPLHPRDRQIDREISQSVLLAHSRRPLSALSLKAIARMYPPPNEPFVDVCLYVPPPYPQRPLEER
jgi:hypothetical protein